MRLSAAPYLFCPTAKCDVVYFAPSSVFRRRDVLVPVFQKEPPGARTVCYCFAIAESDLRKEIEQSGFSTAPERITDLVKANRCKTEVGGDTLAGTSRGERRRTMARWAAEPSGARRFSTEVDEPDARHDGGSRVVRAPRSFPGSCSA